MKVIGILLVIASTASVGFRLALSLKAHCDSLKQFLNALELLEDELSCNATPLVQAFFLTAEKTQGAIRNILQETAEQMESKRWLSPKTAMETAMVQTQNEFEDILTELAEKLGRYDLDKQLSAIRFAKMQAENRLALAEKERSLKSKTYETLGICAGLSVAILLI